MCKIGLSVIEATFGGYYLLLYFLSLCPLVRRGVIVQLECHFCTVSEARGCEGRHSSDQLDRSRFCSVHWQAVSISEILTEECRMNLISSHTSGLKNEANMSGSSGQS